MKIIIVASLTPERVIGKNNIIPWNLPEDLKHFRETTTGFPVIMGRKTFESIGKLLPLRENVVVSRNKIFTTDAGLMHFFDIDSAIDHYRQNKCDKIFIIGGSSVFKQTINFTDEMILSELKFSIEGDSFFPAFNIHEWSRTVINSFPSFDIVLYKRS